MTVVRDGEALTLVNTVRLDDDGLAALDRLGKVTHVVRIGSMHGIDDAFYVQRYGARLWGLPGMKHAGGRKADTLLGAGGETPFSDGTVFVFDTPALPEAVLRIDRDGGILVSCDSLQNWSEADRFFDEATAQKMTAFGFIQPANIGPGWLRTAKPRLDDFEKLESLEFRHLLPAHGTPLHDVAREKLRATFDRVFDR